MTTSLLSPHPPTPQDCTGSAEDDQGKDSRSGTDAGHSPQRSHHWASEQVHCTPPLFQAGLGAGTERLMRIPLKNVEKKGISSRGAG